VCRKLKRAHNGDEARIAYDVMVPVEQSKSDTELMTKQQVGFEPPARFEKVSDEHSQHVENCKH
jgi:hypothetical protein